MGDKQWTPGDPIHDAPSPDPEIAAAEAVVAAFGALDQDAHRRVLTWAWRRYVEDARPVPAALDADTDKEQRDA